MPISFPLIKITTPIFPGFLWNVITKTTIDYSNSNTPKTQKLEKPLIEFQICNRNQEKITPCHAI